MFGCGPCVILMSPSTNTLPFITSSGKDRFLQLQGPVIEGPVVRHQGSSRGHLPWTILDLGTVRKGDRNGGGTRVQFE